MLYNEGTRSNLPLFAVAAVRLAEVVTGDWLRSQQPYTLGPWVGKINQS
ncbi:MAG: hypothetical protein V8K32_05630 [Candidatus Electrothrix gigas]